MRRSNTDVSPTTLKRMPFACSFATSCSSARMKSSIRIETSSGGRRQFSLENANSVRNSMSSSAQRRLMARRASTPRRWPATRGSMRCFAQRPLPSMMIATWRGTTAAAGMSRVELGNMECGRPVESRRGRRRQRDDGQIAIRSVSLAASTLSISAM
jgi:hypothetical protein